MKNSNFNWDGFEKSQIDLALPLLLVKGSNGLLACGYLNIETFNKTNEAVAIVTGVKNFEDMLEAKVVKVSDAGSKIGLKEGQNGYDVLKIIR